MLLVGISPGEGIGTESMVERALAKHANVVGLVYSPVSAPVLGCPTVRGDARTLPFVDNSFDYVVSNAVIEHVGGRNGASQMLLEGNRVARRGWIHTTPNRRFPIEVHTGVPVLHWLPRAAREGAFSLAGIAFPEEHYYLFTARSLRRLGIPVATRVASRVGVAMTLFIMNPELAQRLDKHHEAVHRSLRAGGTSARLRS
ncbi:MAG: methyltransferase domain-containing protein [Pseudonocardiaceae bacterium]